MNKKRMLMLCKFLILLVVVVMMSGCVYESNCVADNDYSCYGPWKIIKVGGILAPEDCADYFSVERGNEELCLIKSCDGNMDSVFPEDKYSGDSFILETIYSDFCVVSCENDNDCNFGETKCIESSGDKFCSPTCQNDNDCLPGLTKCGGGICRPSLAAGSSVVGHTGSCQIGNQYSCKKSAFSSQWVDLPDCRNDYACQIKSDNSWNCETGGKSCAVGHYCKDVSDTPRCEEPSFSSAHCIAAGGLWKNQCSNGAGDICSGNCCLSPKVDSSEDDADECSDGFDNDCDGKIDCEDSVCSQSDFCPKLLHYYKFEDYVAADHSGTLPTLSGKLQGNPGWESNSPEGDISLIFDGVDDYIELPNSDSLNELPGLTLESWIKKDSFGNSFGNNQENIFSNTQGGGYKLAISGWNANSNTGKLLFQIHDGTNYRDLYSPTAIPLGNWIHVVGTWESGKKMKLYINGKKVAESANTYAGPIDDTNTDTRAFIGAESNGVDPMLTRSFKGSIDSVKIYNYARSAEEIEEDYASGDILIHHYDFSSINDGKVTDLSGNGNDGSVNGAIIENGVATFDGSNDYIDAGNDGSLKVSDGLTVMSWVKGPLQQNSVIASRYDYGNVNQRSWSLGSAHVANKWDKLRAIISDDGEWSGNNKGKLYRSTDIAFDNTWHHVAMTFDSGTFKLFVDGSEQVPDIHTDLDVDHLFHSNVGVSLGRSLKNGIGKLFFDGQMDEVKIYNYALTPQKVLEKFEEISSPENGMCNDQLDNDGDGLVDCADPDCEGEKNVLNGQCCQDSISCTENIGITGFCYNYVCVDGEPIGGTYIPPIDNFPGGYICSWGGDLNHIDDHTFCPGGAQCGLDINVQLALADVDGDGNNDLHNFYFCNIVDLDGDGVNDDVDVCDENKPEKPVYLPPNQNAGCQLADINADNLVEGVDIDQFIELYNQRDQINADLNSVAASPIHFTENNQIHGGDIDMFIEHYNNR